MRDPGFRGKAAGAGAVVVVALASICCILPLVLGAIGLSGAVVSAFFEPLRPYFLALAAVLLALGFYFSFRAPAAGGACATGSSKLSRASRPLLILAAFATAGLALLPGVAGIAGGTAAPAPEVASKVVVLRVDGMTCESCASGVRARLLDVPGVLDAAVSYDRKVAEVRVREERAPEPGLLVEAVEMAGFSAEVRAR